MAHPAEDHTVIVRRATLADAADVYGLVEEYYAAVAVVARDDRAALRAGYLEAGNGGVWLACRGREPIGCILYHQLTSLAAAGEVKRLYVMPAFRRRGVAQALFDPLERFAKSRGDEWLYLDTHDGLAAAIAFYRRNGFAPCPRYNDNPQATIFMRKRLTAAR